PEEETEVQEGACRLRRCEQARACRPEELIQCDARATPRQIDGPHIIKRNSAKKVVHPQLQTLELVCRDLRPLASLLTLLFRHRASHGCISVPFFTDGSRVVPRRSSEDIPRAVHSGHKRASTPPLPALSESLRPFSRARLARYSPARSSGR